MFFIAVIYPMCLFFFNFSSTDASIKIIHPKKGDTLISGRAYSICWEANNNYPVNIDYSTNNGKDWSNIIESWGGNCYEWIPPANDLENLLLKVELKENYAPALTKMFKPAHLGEINSVRFSEDANYFLSSGADSKVLLWDFKDGKIIDSIVFPKTARVYSAEFFHNPDTILIAYDSTALIWVRKKNEIINLTKFENIVRSIAVSPVDNIFAISSFSGNVKLYQTTDDIQEINQFYSLDTSGIYNVRFSPDGQLLHFSDYNGNTLIYRKPFSSSYYYGLLSNGKNKKGDVIWSADVSFDSKYISTGGVDDTVRVWDIDKAELINKYSGHKFHVRSVNFHPNEFVCMSGSLDGYIKQWDLFSLENYCEPINNLGQVISLDYSYDGRYIISGGRDSAIKIWRNCYGKVFYDSVEVILKNLIIAKIPHLFSSPNRKKNIPVIIDNPTGYKSEDKILANIKVEIPNRLLHLRNTEFQISHGLTRKDTIDLMVEMMLNGSLDTIKTLVLKGDKNFEEIKLLEFEPLESINLLIEKLDGSITIEDNCIGELDRDVHFAESPLNMVIQPNPSFNENINVFINIIEDGIYALDIVSSHGKYKRLFEREYNHGNFYFSIDLTDFTSGVYFLRLVSPNDEISRKLILLK